MWDYLELIPLVAVGTLIAVPLYFLYRSDQARDKEWDEEEKRQQRVKDLYPDQPSYEERMGVHYGHTEDEDDNNG